MISSKVIYWTTVLAVFASSVGRAANEEPTRVLDKYMNKMDIESVGSKFYFIEDSLNVNWYHANILCKRMGLELASFNSVEEQNLLIKHLNFTNRSFKYPNGVWIGLTKLPVPGEWFWISSGRNFNGKGWHPAQPNSKNNHTCGQLWITGIDDTDCTTNRPFVCQMVKLSNDNPF